MKKIELPENPKILVTRTDRIGDLVLTTPVFKALREKFPEAWIAALVFIEHRDIVKGNPYLDEVILYDKKGSEKGLLGQVFFAGALRKKKFDVAIHCHGTNRMHLAAWLAGIPRRIGYARRAPWTLTHVHPYNKKEGARQEAEYLFDLLEPLGIAGPGKVETFFPVSGRAARSLENLLFHLQVPRDLPWVVLNPSASDITKMWPPEKFAELAARLQKEMKCAFLAVGAAKDKPVVESLREKSTVPVFDLGGKLSLGMLGALLKKSAMLISNDSGPVHIAAAVGTPVVSIFGRYEPGLDPDRWRPLGGKCRIVAKDVSKIPPAERKFTYINDITVDEVYQAVKELLSGKYGQPAPQYSASSERMEDGGRRMEQKVLRHPSSGIHYPKKIRRVLVVHPYGIGDLLFVTPVLRALRLIPTMETVDLLLGSRTREVAENNPHVNDIFILDKDRLRRQSPRENFRDLWDLGKKLRAKKYDLLLDYSLRPENAFWSWLFLGIPKRAGFAYKRRAFFHNIRYPLPEGYWKQHAVDFYAGLAELAGVPVGDRFLEYYFPPNEAELEKRVMTKLGGLGNDFITVNPGGGDSWGKEAGFKRWPVENFSEFIQKLRSKVAFKGVCILGGKSEAGLCDSLKDSLKVPAVVLAGETTLAETAMLLKKSRLFVGNDGGLVHLARSLRVPLIAFYGPVPPEVYGPYPASPESAAVYKRDLGCRPCYYRFRFNKACPTIACLKELCAGDAFNELNEKRFFEKVK